jgi:hypothetical protein
VSGGTFGKSRNAASSRVEALAPELPLACRLEHHLPVGQVAQERGRASIAWAYGRNLRLSLRGTTGGSGGSARLLLHAARVLGCALHAANWFIK